MIHIKSSVLQPRKQIVLGFICTFVLLLFCARTPAQAGIDTGSVTGTIKDPTGAMVVGARCTLTNTGTGVSQTTLSTSAGAYTFPARPGRDISAHGDSQGIQGL